MPNIDSHRILEALRRNRQGLTPADLFREMKAPRKERARIEGRLRELEGLGLVRRVKTRYLLPLESDVARGRFETTGRGYGFVIAEGRAAEDIYVQARLAKGAGNGDEVEVLFKEKGRTGRPEGRIVRILRKERKSLLGLYVERSGRPHFAAFDSAGAEEIPLQSLNGLFPKPGMIVSVDRTGLALTGVLGFPDDAGVDAHVVARRYDLAEAFPPEVEAEAEAAAARPDDEEIARADFRDWTTFTIDGETAQDFDDAVSVRALPGGRRLLGVHIADVSHYVRPGTVLDDDARERATSVYFPGLTLPMLPERLSNDVCSLRPRLDRRAFSVLLEIDAEGRVVRSEFTPSLIRTSERLTYTAVFSVFQGDPGERERLRAIVPDLLEMRALAELLRRRRLEAGSLDFDLVEPELVYTEGKLTSVEGFVPNEAHKLIEEFMVAANVAVAAYLHRRGIPSLYRVHAEPDESDLDKLREILALFGLVLPRPAQVESRDLQAVLRAAAGKPAEAFINTRVLRSLRLAVYADENIGHYGLAQADYTHFTSPIRRYPDLVVHRVLKAALRGAKQEASGLAILAEHCSERERRADKAEKELVEWRIFRLLKECLGDEFRGLVTDIGRAGLVVALEEFLVEGTIAFADLGGDYFVRRSPAVLAGKRTGLKFELGQEIRVVVAAVDPMLRRLTLVPASKS
ncbi:MAG: ribonuclease R [Acidobacteriota bacterium]|nr:ribonuclease R [Acidobacteriota bacterium]